MPLVDGIQTPGKTGSCTHLGDPLTCQQIRELPDGAEVIITWNGGNGPHPYRILVDTGGLRRVDGGYCDLLLPWDSWGVPQQVTFHRITLGWDEHARAWSARKPRDADHLLEQQEILRGIPQPQWSPLQLAVASALDEVSRELGELVWQETGGGLFVEREFLAVAASEVARQVFGSDVVAPPYPGGPTFRWAVMLASSSPAATDDQDRVVAAAIRDVQDRLYELPYTSPVGLPMVNRDLIFGPVEEAAAAALGEHWRRALRRARHESGKR